MYEMFYWGIRNFNTGLILCPEGIVNFMGVKGVSPDQVINEAQKNI
jgi:hypothetical protein